MVAGVRVGIQCLLGEPVIVTTWLATIWRPPVTWCLSFRRIEAPQTARRYAAVQSQNAATVYLKSNRFLLSDFAEQHCATLLTARFTPWTVSSLQMSSRFNVVCPVGSLVCKTGKSKQLLFFGFARHRWHRRVMGQYGDAEDTKYLRAGLTIHCPPCRLTIGDPLICSLTTTHNQIHTQIVLKKYLQMPLTLQLSLRIVSHLVEDKCKCHLRWPLAGPSAVAGGGGIRSSPLVLEIILLDMLNSILKFWTTPGRTFTSYVARTPLFKHLVSGLH